VDNPPDDGFLRPGEEQRQKRKIGLICKKRPMERNRGRGGRENQNLDWGTITFRKNRNSREEEGGRKRDQNKRR